LETLHETASFGRFSIMPNHGPAAPSYPYHVSLSLLNHVIASCNLDAHFSYQHRCARSLELSLDRKRIVSHHRQELDPLVSRFPWLF